MEPLYRKVVNSTLDESEIRAGWFFAGNDGYFDIWFAPVNLEPRWRRMWRTFTRRMDL